MTELLLLGAGKIGRMIARLLHDSGDYAITVADADPEALKLIQQALPVRTEVVDASSEAGLTRVIRGKQFVISALSFRFNPLVAKVCLDCEANYFDLTEDIQTTQAVRELARRAKTTQVFVPQCGLAPGFVGISAFELTKWFDEVDTLHMRVGALPQFPTNALKYNLTWSTDGLINEYCNPCEAIYEYKRMDVLPLEGYELFDMDGIQYEAFNTSGGLGTLCETLDGRVRELNYKTVRYPGHRDKAKFLIEELRMKERRELLKDVLEFAVPITYQDVVVIFCSATGRRKGRFVQKSDARKVYPKFIAGEIWSAIQVTTAASVCAVVDLHREGKINDYGFIRQEQIPLPDFLANRFGQMYQGSEFVPRTLAQS
jgi:saccharopine dehydrogenase-like NADP-dependent oxidoreductase